MELAFQTARMALLVALVSILAFVLLSVSPVDPLQTNVGQAALGAMSPEQVERLKGYWGVDLPPAERYLSWAADVLRGDMGTSLLYRRPVAEVIWEKLSNSLWLLASSWLLSGLLGFTLGVLAGRKRDILSWQPAPLPSGPPWSFLWSLPFILSGFPSA